MANLSPNVVAALATLNGQIADLAKAIAETNATMRSTLNTANATLLAGLESVSGSYEHLNDLLNGAIVADGTGKSDATDAIQAALDRGGDLFLPAGLYMVDAVKTLSLRSNTNLVMDPDAVLQVIPNDAYAYQVLNIVDVSNVTVTGGQIVGDRDTHTFKVVYKADGVTVNTARSTHEWGHAIRISGATNVVIRDVKARDCTGDGCSVGASTSGRGWTLSRNILLDNVEFTGSRRQGLSVGNCVGVRVVNSRFADAGTVNGTSPRCGIDLEPNNDEIKDAAGNVTRAGTDAGWLHDVWIENCIIEGNGTYGVNVFLRIDNVTFKNNIIRKNNSAGLVNVQGTSLAIVDNLFDQNGGTGLHLSAETTGVVENNIFNLNYQRQSPTPRATPLVGAGVLPGTKRDLLQNAGDKVAVKINTYK